MLKRTGGVGDSNSNQTIRLSLERSWGKLGKSNTTFRLASWNLSKILKYPRARSKKVISILNDSSTLSHQCYSDGQATNDLLMLRLTGILKRKTRHT